MQTVKQKVNNAAASAKERVDVLKAKTEGKAEKSMASNKEDKEMAKENKKAKEAEAKMKLHEDKAGNAAGHLQGKQQGQFGGAGAAPLTQGGNQHTAGTTAVPLSHNPAPAGGHNQYDQAVPPPQEPLDGHRP
ncbi:uncharacterized protein [Henckelia pumila]|uniref:uncharacterized protein n=1 Tax=Henckelia pumila TaxID=405737 RepID=UPI003C6DEB2A